MKLAAPRRPRNPIAKAVRTPLYKLRVVANKRKKLLEKWSAAGVRAGNVCLDEPASGSIQTNGNRLSPTNGANSILD
jgi:hypothetical protein